MVPSVLISWSIEERANEYFAWLLALGAAMLGVFVAFDIILFYIFFELTLVPLFFPLMLTKSGKFTVELTATDLVSKKKKTITYPLTVVDPPK